MTGKRVAVVGSINLDLVARAPRLPAPGETVTGAVLSRQPGGKGGNQALAARRLGARVAMFGAVGRDDAADAALALLRAEGVDLAGVEALDGPATGTAFVIVDAAGENQIVVAPGANAVWRPATLDLAGFDAVLCQLEIPLPTVAAAARACRGLFCLNLAPARPVPAELLAMAGLLVVNESEAAALGDLLGHHDGTVAVTLGARGALLRRQGVEIARATPPAVEAVDSAGAGDVFCAALALALIEGMAPRDALELACTAGACAATRAGTQQSAPLRREVEAVRDRESGETSR